MERIMKGILSSVKRVKLNYLQNKQAVNKFVGNMRNTKLYIFTE